MSDTREIRGIHPFAHDARRIRYSLLYFWGDWTLILPRKIRGAAWNWLTGAKITLPPERPFQAFLRTYWNSFNWLPNWLLDRLWPYAFPEAR